MIFILILLILYHTILKFDKLFKNYHIVIIMSFENVDYLINYIKNSNNPYLKEFKIDDIVLNKPKYVEPSNLRISTMTYTANINVLLDLQNLYDNINIDNIEYPKIISCEYGNNIPKGTDIKKKKKFFANQLTLKIQFDDFYKVNMKIFNNGKIGITGCKDNDITKKILNFIINIIKNINNNNKIILNNNELMLKDLDVVLINSDFKCGFEIKRDVLYNILKKMNLYVTYEPDIYPGVNLKFYYNKIYSNNGICYCDKKCNGKNIGDGLNKCKKITIAIFQSGSVIITGARNNTQKNISYRFINNIIKSNYNSILKYSI